MLPSRSSILINVSHVFEIRVFEHLTGTRSVVRVVSDHPKDELLALFRHVRYELRNSSVFLRREVKLHVSCMLLKSFKQSRIRRSEDVMNFVNLIQLIGAWEDGEKRENLEEHTANAPDIHLIPVVPVS